ncbi:PIN domain-containing protein [Meiothermus rufus]|uniref:PIN domain-containing protein n=1 Tax=Meiothermus rufus TaxID=604332 RepID=UPI00040430C0|nr:PIN domain-containing protein [Meiothermus rufus]
MRLFLDANVLFAAAWQEGRSRALFTLAQQGRCTLCTSAYALEEARRNLQAKRPEALTTLEALLEEVILVAEPRRALIHKALERGLPPKDAPILAAAWEARAAALVTGDRQHFGHLYGQPLRVAVGKYGSVSQVEVLAPGAALERLL